MAPAAEVGPEFLTHVAGHYGADVPILITALGRGFVESLSTAGPHPCECGNKGPSFDSATSGNHP